MSQGKRNLQEKFEVYKDGEPVEDCFVLQPESDPAAERAIEAYASETDNEELAQALRSWLVDIVLEPYLSEKGDNL